MVFFALKVEVNLLTSLKIGLLVDAADVSGFVYDLAEWGQRQANISVSHFIVVRRPAIASRSKLGRLIVAILQKRILHFLADLCWTLLCKFEKFSIAKSKFKYLLKAGSLDDVVKNRIDVEPNVSLGGKVLSFTDLDIARVKELNLDVIIRCGSGILKGEILNVARFGIWSFHHGDNFVNRGMPAGFWEINKQQNVTGFIIQRLTEEIDGGQVIYRGWFPTKGYYALNNLTIQSRSNFYLKKMLLNLADKRKMPQIQEQLPYCEILYKLPTIFDLILYATARISRKTSHVIINKIYRRHYKWNVAFQKCNWRSLVMWKATTIKNPNGRYLADPFLVSVDDKDYCFVEDFDIKKSKGDISLYELEGKSAKRVGVILTENFHLSFPYVFEYNNKFYMVPESSGINEIRLYEAIEFPRKWKFHHTLVSNISAADTLIIPKNDAWWLLTTAALTEVGEHSSELMIFKADTPLSSDWQPLTSNPVRVDGRNARNGGIIFEGDRIYRVAQTRGFLKYGKGLEIREIMKIDLDGYYEEHRYSLSPRFKTNIVGGHHLHSSARYTAFDYLVK